MNGHVEGLELVQRGAKLVSFDNLQEQAGAFRRSCWFTCGKIESDLEIWAILATEIYRRVGGETPAGWDDSILWDGEFDTDGRRPCPWDGWDTMTEEELREYVAGLDK